MSELRKDPLFGRWVIISAERSKRGSDWASPPTVIRSEGFCPFCAGNEGRTPPEIYSLRSDSSKADEPGWQIRVVPNKFPALSISGELERRGEGLYDLMNGVGAHEVIIETPDHQLQLADFSEKQIENLLYVYQQRIISLQQDPRFQYVLVFKNSGYAAGASLEHPHSQIISTPILPKRVLEEIEGFKQYFLFKERCVVCDVIYQELQNSEKRVVALSDYFVALEPFASRFPFETWIIPVKHWQHYEKMEQAPMADFAKMLKDVLLRLKKALNDPPYNFILHTSPVRDDREIIFHWYLEIIPKLTKIAGFEWGSGFYINQVPPEEAARWLKNQS